MPLDAQVEALLAQLAALNAPPLSSLTPEQARAVGEGMVGLAGPQVAVAAVRDIEIPVDGAEIGARVYTPEGDGPHPIVVFIHGGGFVICSLNTHDNIARMICRDAAAVVVSLDYRMAPEFPFPVAPHDCFDATRWIVANAAELGGDPARIAVCGDSAGGNLSAVVSQMARDAGGPAIAFQALIYPATDMTAEGGSIDENATGYYLEKESMEWFEAQYLQAEGDHVNPLASPALHATLAGLPPAFIATCEFDPLRDQGEAYAAALEAAGVPAEVKRYDGMIHAVANMTGVIDGGRQLVEDIGQRLHRALHAS